jgi:hypothetical protein
MIEGLNLQVLLGVLFVIYMVYIVSYWSIPWLQKTKWLNFTLTLFNLSLVFTLVVLAFEADDREKENKRKVSGEFNEDTERFFTDIEDKFLKNRYLLPLYKSMYPNNPVVQRIPIPKDFDWAEARRAEPPMANIIFQRIENMIFTLLVENPSVSASAQSDLVSWLATWELWLSSPILQELWKYDKVMFNETTQIYIDALIDKTKNMGVNP